MSQSFALVNGDLLIGQGRAFQIVTGNDKLVQDLQLWILERIGTDPATPTYGSRLDGGVEDGQVDISYIGQIVSQSTLTGIRTEVIRLIQNYQAMQYNKIRAETIAYQGQTTLDNDEVIDSINTITTTAMGTTVVVQVSLNLLSGDVIKLTLPVATGAN